MGLWDDIISAPAKAGRATYDFFGDSKDKVGDVLVDTFTSRNERRAIDKASKKQAEGMDRATDLQREMYQQNRADMMPWMDSSKKYLGQMGGLMDQGYFNMPEQDLEGPAFNFNMEMDPGYQFRMDQAMDTLKKSPSFSANRRTTGTMAGLMDRASGIASDEYGRAFGRQYEMYSDDYQRRGNAYNRKATELGNQFNRISGMGGMGAAQQMAGMGQNYASGMGNLYMQQGRNASNAIMANQQASQNNPWAPRNFLNPQTLLQGAGMYFNRKQG